jgi:hypothetical protein
MGRIPNSKKRKNQDATCIYTRAHGRRARSTAVSTGCSRRPDLGGAGEAGGDGGVVHGVVEGLRLRHARPQLPRLLLRQAPHERPAPGRRRRRVLLRRGRRGLDVVGLARPPQQRRPPLAVAALPAARGADHPGARPSGGPRRRRRSRRAGGEGDGGRGARCHRHFGLGRSLRFGAWWLLLLWLVRGKDGGCWWRSRP